MSLTQHSLKGMNPEIKPLAHQVAGHRPKVPSATKAFYQAPNGTILKHVRTALRLHRELKFYRLIFEDENTDPILKDLRNFLPKYLGTIQLDLFPDEYFIHLKDITHSFNKACIADVKIGRQTYHPTASPEKIAYEKLKYPKLPHIGFRIGFRVYRPCAEMYEFHDHKNLLSLENSEILEKGVGSYFNLPEKLRKDAILAILGELKELHNWFELQRNFAFYATSLLCVYDGNKTCEFHQSQVHGSSNGSLLNKKSEVHPPCPNCTNDKSSECNKCCTNLLTNGHNPCSSESTLPPSDGCVQVKMIDFNHVYTTTERDDNYLFGLNNFMKYLEKLLTDY